jgi:hypothetical protein
MLYGDNLTIDRHDRLQTRHVSKESLEHSVFRIVHFYSYTRYDLSHKGRHEAQSPPFASAHSLLHSFIK